MRFNSLNAREMAVRSVAARKAAAAERTPSPATIPLTPGAPPGTDPYVTERLSRVRGQLDRLDGLMATEKDPQRIDRLASAQYRLAEQERILSGRPLPGSRRPGREPARHERPAVDNWQPKPVRAPVEPLRG
jgi:hypothetical protein